MILLIFLTILDFSTEISERYYSRSNDNICADKNEGCIFTISSNFPKSPKIPTALPTQAILGSYRYIYLLFSIPKNQAQKTFYLEAYDTSDGGTIISDGDCYLINTNVNTDYELRIDSTLKQNSFIQFGFFGISNNFKMAVKLKFILDQVLYLTDIALTSSNSLYKSSLSNLVENNREMNIKLAKQKERQYLAKKAITRIVKKMFDFTIDIEILDEQYFYSQTFSAPPFTVTVSWAVGLESSTEKFFQSKGDFLSETKVIKGKINAHVDGLNLLDGKINIDNKYLNILKVLDAYNKKIGNMVLEFGLETDYYTVTVSIDSYNALIYTIRYYYGYSEIIYYEIEIKIEVDNNLLLELIKSKANSYANVYEYSYPDINFDQKALVVSFSLAVVIIAIIATNGAAAPALALLPL
jgi:hypothetical protein